MAQKGLCGYFCSHLEVCENKAEGSSSKQPLKCKLSNLKSRQTFQTDRFGSWWTFQAGLCISLQTNMRGSLPAKIIWAYSSDSDTGDWTLLLCTDEHCEVLQDQELSKIMPLLRASLPFACHAHFDGEPSNSLSPTGIHRAPSSSPQPVYT